MCSGTALRYEAAPGEEVYFHAGGIDYRFEIRLNERKLYASEGMFTPVDLKLPEDVKKGDMLTVLILPHPKNGGGEPGTRDEAAQSVKPAVC